MRALALVCSVGVGLLSLQDPERAPKQDPQTKKAEAPIDPPALPPVPEPRVETIPRGDLPARVLPPSPIEGMWALSSATRGGRTVSDIRGYLAIGRQYLSIHILESDPDAGLVVQSGFRRYRLEAGALVTTSVVGHDNLNGGRLRHDRPGVVETRSIAIVGGKLRITRAAGSILEFARVE